MLRARFSDANMTNGWDQLAYVPWAVYGGLEAASSQDYIGFIDELIRNNNVPTFEHLQLKAWKHDAQIQSLDASQMVDSDELDFRVRLYENHLVSKHRLRAERLTMYKLKWFSVFYDAALALFFWTLVLYKIQNDGFYPFYHFFTNWMLTFNAIFYTADLLSFLDPSGAVQRAVILIIWWPYFGCVVAVFLLVFPLKGLNPEIILETAQLIGWSATFVGEGVVHALPPFFDVIWVALRWQDLVDVHACFRWTTDRLKLAFVFYVAWMFVYANLFIATYCSSFDYHKVYGVHLDSWLAFIGIEIIFFFVVAVPIVMISPVGSYFRKSAYARDFHPLELTELQVTAEELWQRREARRRKKYEEQEPQPVVLFEAFFPAGTLVKYEASIEPSADWAQITHKVQNVVHHM